MRLDYYLPYSSKIQELDILELHIRTQIEINQLLIFTEKFSPLTGFEPGTYRYQAKVLPIELSWLFMKHFDIKENGYTVGI